MGKTRTYEPLKQRPLVQTQDHLSAYGDSTDWHTDGNFAGFVGCQDVATIKLHPEWTIANKEDLNELVARCEKLESGVVSMLAEFSDGAMSQEQSAQLKTALSALLSSTT